MERLFNDQIPEDSIEAHIKRILIEGLSMRTWMKWLGNVMEIHVYQDMMMGLPDGNEMVLHCHVTLAWSDASTEQVSKWEHLLMDARYKDSWAEDLWRKANEFYAPIYDGGYEGMFAGHYVMQAGITFVVDLEDQAPTLK